MIRHFLPRHCLRGATIAAAALAASCAGNLPGTRESAWKPVPASTEPIRPPPAIVLRPTPKATERARAWPWSQAKATPARPIEPPAAAPSEPRVEAPAAAERVARLPAPTLSAGEGPAVGSVEGGAAGVAEKPRPPADWPSLPKSRPAPAASPALPAPPPIVEAPSALAPVVLPTPLATVPIPAETPVVALPTPPVRLPSVRETGESPTPSPAFSSAAPAFAPQAAPRIVAPPPSPTPRTAFRWPWAREAPPPRAAPGRSVPPPEASRGIIWPWSRSDRTEERPPAFAPPEVAGLAPRGMAAPRPGATPSTLGSAGAPVRVSTAAPPRAPTWTPGVARMATPTPELTPEARSDARTKPDLLTFTVPLSSLGDVEDLRSRPQGRELLAAARRNPDAPILVHAYVTEADTRTRHADPGSLSDEMVIQTARYLTDQGIDPNRISGKGMGIDEAVGRAVVVTIDLGEAPSERRPRASEIARRRGLTPSPKT